MTLPPPSPDDSPSSTAPALPSHIGRYRPLRVIGEGGMGTVYEAEQEQPRRTVALKVIRSGLAAPDLLRRFELESLLLARLQHPGIAQVFDAGTAETPQGEVPYFAMELVQGETLDVFVRQRGLSVPERLALVALICDAVQHAHQKGIVHRDLKPANILVGGDGQPKILDFGVARVTDSDRQATMQTEVGQIVGTLPYMSPEQVAGDSTDIDTRSDVYSLGVILYELLAERRPHELDRKDILEAIRTIREDDARRLSSVSPAFGGDVETITAKALEKDRERRYRSPDELAADIRHHLANEPIVARPASVRYQLTKFARRNRALVVGVSAVFLALLAGTIVSWMQASRAIAAEDLALRRLERSEQERAKALAVKVFLQEMLESARPDSAVGREATIREALDQAAKSVAAGSLDGEPAVEIEIRETISRAYKELGYYVEAEGILEPALELIREHLGPASQVLGTFLSNQGILAAKRGDLDRAEALYLESLQIGSLEHGAAHRDTLVTKANLGELLKNRGDLESAERLLREVLAMQRRVLEPERSSDIASTLTHLAQVLMARDELLTAEEFLAEALSIWRAALGDRHSKVVAALSNLAIVRMRQGKLAEVEPVLREVLATNRELLGDDHPSVASDLDGLAVLRLQLGDSGEEPESMLVEALRIRRATLGEDHAKVGASLDHLASLHKLRGDFDLAEPLFIEALELRRRALGDGHPSLRESLNNLGELWLLTAGAESARKTEPLFREHLQITRSVTEEGHPSIAGSLLALAESLRRQARCQEAETCIREAIAIREAKLPPDDWRRFSAKGALGAVLVGKGDHATAEKLLLEAMAAFRADPKAPAFLRREGAANLVALYQAWGKPERAAEWRD